MLDRMTYGGDSLLDAKMQPWQGPALLSWNDSTFSPADFHSISRIGQDDKLAEPNTTGTPAHPCHCSLASV